MLPREAEFKQAARAIASAEALLIAAGAGMGVDSGLPDFRGNQGFWKAYPPYEKLGLNFIALANPRWFTADPSLAWGFYGHRLNLYRSTRPHAGFQVLKRWAERTPHGSFVYTSNVDGHFQRAGFSLDRILEVHGTIEWLQCTRSCGVGLFPSDVVQIDLDETTMRAREPLPACPSCGALARPNILLFNDPSWDFERSYSQELRSNDWLNSRRKARLVIVECGAGLAIPTVRHLCEHIVGCAQNVTLIRINLREAAVPSGQIGLPMGALEALQAIEQQLGEIR